MSFYVIVLLCVAISSFVIGEVVGVAVHKHKENTTPKEDSNELSIENSTDLVDAYTAYEIASNSTNNLKQSIIADLVLSINKTILEGEFKWTAFNHQSIANNIKEYFTKEEILDIFEPKGYHVSFLASPHCELLMISWKADETEEG